MSNVIPLASAHGITPELAAHVAEFDRTIVAVIEEAIDLGIPQGLIVAVLHGHAHAQTQRMVEAS